MSHAPPLFRTMNSMARRDSSAASTLIQPVHRFDLLISEHQTLVKTAQESVQQALDALENASSEDDQRAAKLQAQSLLQRTDELVLTLRLATEVRKELVYAYKEISKAQQQEPQLQVERIQWLEQQMGKLILSRRRGRPAAKGRRTIAAMNSDRGLTTKARSEMYHHERDGATLPQVIPQPNTATSSRLSGASKLGNGQNGESIQSSQVSPSRDSDTWHSESEANWTIADAHSGVVGNDESEDLIQVENDRPEPSSLMSIEPLSLLENQVALPSTGVVSNLKTRDTFEQARSTVLFGACSWNSLPLALTNHFVTLSVNTQDEKDEPSLLRTELEELMAELQSLREKVLSAAQASMSIATPNGNKTSRGNQGNKAAKANDTLNETPHEHALPPIQNNLQSKKSSTQMVLYPRPATVWQELQTPAKSKHGLPKIRDNKASVQRVINKKVQISNEIVTKDLFGSADHNQKHVEHHLRRLNSIRHEEKKDAIQVLGHIATDNTKSDVMETLRELFLSESRADVRYEVMKSLLNLGYLDEPVMIFMAQCLREGSYELKIDVLRLALRSKAFRQQECCEKCTELQKCLHNLLSDSHPDVSLHAALLLSSLQYERESCIMVLKRALHTSDSTFQVEALSCLVNIWHYWDKDVLTCAFELLQRHIDWQKRLCVVKDLRVIGASVLDEVKEAKVFEVLHQRLHNEPIEAVRYEIGQLMTDLNMSEKVQTLLLGWLEYGDEFKRADAVIALGAFGSKTAKYLHSLLDCLELDPSLYVRVQVVKLLGRLKFNSHQVVNKLLEISKGSGLVARESQVALQKIVCQTK